ncbi:arylamine N-acetyltransferase family protein [Haloechinothrix halophila]|uniref:arylamine N-acetyltransferase family protein n=1 Tax=Haloechinothrix halophila TaxID=1069073 RepID=UPI000411FEBB|nr:arylamine N-acetyltransferase [Haloechinothrix halophila]
MDDTKIDAYLARIGARRPSAATPDTLRELHERHLNAVPFENLAIHLGEPISLAADALHDKIVRRRRGGFCYELNGAFALLLRALGFDVSLLAAKVYRDDGTLGPPFDHLALRVDCGESWLVDVGFGRHTRHPLRLASDAPQRDPEGVFRVADAPDGDSDVYAGDKPVYRLEPRPRELRDFGPTCWWQSTSPESHFTRSVTCSLPTASGRVTLSGNRLVETIDGERKETTLASNAEILATYQSRFGIHLDQVPRVDT